MTSNIYRDVVLCAIGQHKIKHGPINIKDKIEKEIPVLLLQILLGNMQLLIIGHLSQHIGNKIKNC